MKSVVFALLQCQKKKEGNVATVSNNKNYLLCAGEEKFGICQTFTFLQMYIFSFSLNLFLKQMK